jgi:rubrerythrin
VSVANNQKVVIIYLSYTEPFGGYAMKIGKEEFCPVCGKRVDDCVCCPECGHVCALDEGGLHCPVCGPVKSKEEGEVM